MSSAVSFNYALLALKKTTKSERHFSQVPSRGEKTKQRREDPLLGVFPIPPNLSKKSKIVGFCSGSGAAWPACLQKHVWQKTQESDQGHYLSEGARLLLQRDCCRNRRSSVPQCRARFCRRSKTTNKGARFEASRCGRQSTASR